MGPGSHLVRSLETFTGSPRRRQSEDSLECWQGASTGFFAPFLLEAVVFGAAVAELLIK